jgi:hypothetical protein
MNMPGFTAEAALYKTRGYYRFTTPDIYNDYNGHLVNPQFSISCIATYDRGVGTVPSECPSADKSGALCYPFCAPGFHGAGPYCWQNCPPGYADDGATCRFGGPSVISADTRQCPWYDVCCTWHDGAICPTGYNRSACTCNANIFIKNSYWRGAGWSGSCAPGLNNEDGLCYRPCPEGFFGGAGPICCKPGLYRPFIDPLPGVPPPYVTPFPSFPTPDVPPPPPDVPPPPPIF